MFVECMPFSLFFPFFSFREQFHAPLLPQKTLGTIKTKLNIWQYQKQNTTKNNI